MKVKKLCKLISPIPLINVYEDGFLVDQGRRDDVKRKFGDRKVENISCGTMDNKWGAALWLELKECEN